MPPAHDLYDVIARRRDVRTEFTGGPVDDDVLLRILDAAHRAPSVGLSQPWDFVLVTDRQVRGRFAEHVAEQRRLFADGLPADRAATVGPITVDGVLASTLRELLAIPGHVRPVAWLCVGPVTHLAETPDLERHRWRSRRSLADAIHHDRYGGASHSLG